MTELSAIRRGRKTLVCGATFRDDYFTSKLGLGGSFDSRENGIVLDRPLAEVKKIVDDVNQIRARWPGNSAEWWLGLEDTAEAKAFREKLVSIDPPEIPSAEHLEKFRGLVKGHAWKFARTMKWCPHWYTLRSTWETSAKFEWFVSFVRKFGVAELYGKTRPVRHVYFYDEKWKYWTMGCPRAVTILVNRAEVGGEPPAKQGGLF